MYGSSTPRSSCGASCLSCTTASTAATTASTASTATGGRSSPARQASRGSNQRPSCSPSPGRQSPRVPCRHTSMRAISPVDYGEVPAQLMEGEAVGLVGGPGAGGEGDTPRMRYRTTPLAPATSASTPTAHQQPQSAATTPRNLSDLLP
ncbi:hypothetical protein Agub_g6192, partial [Astrephomene gubernaculifera]